MAKTDIEGDNLDQVCPSPCLCGRSCTTLFAQTLEFHVVWPHLRAHRYSIGYPQLFKPHIARLLSGGPSPIT